MFKVKKGKQIIVFYDKETVDKYIKAGYTLIKENNENKNKDGIVDTKCTASKETTNKTNK